VLGRLIWGLGISVLLAGGCGSSGGDSAPVIWCDGLCAAVARCGFHDPTCHSTCVQDRSGLARESASGATAQEPCLEQLSCQALSGDEAAWQQELQACWDQAVSLVAVTGRARQICPQHAMAWFDCGYTLSVDDCEHMYSMWNDAVIDQVARCDAKQSCDEFKACEQNVFSNP
jgi:hypothetical protein